VAGRDARRALAAVETAGLGRPFAEQLLGRASEAVRDLDIDAWLTLPSGLCPT
jgi:hypothetical protein